MKKVLIIDFMGVLYASHYAFKNLTYEEKETGAIYGFVSQLLNVINHEKPTNVLIALEGGSNKRYDISKDYKANRSERPSELAHQIKALDEIIKLMGIKSVAVKGYEADDVIASACIQWASDDCKCVIYSDDKDLMQLVNANVSQYAPRKGKMFGVTDVVEKFDVAPSQISELLALQGDASDNIPGAKGIGPKSASALLKAYNNIDNLYANLGNLKPTFRDKLVKSKEAVAVSRLLTELHGHLDIGDVPETAEVDRDLLFAELAKWGLTTIIEKLEQL